MRNDYIFFRQPAILLSWKWRLCFVIIVIYGRYPRVDFPNISYFEVFIVWIVWICELTMYTLFQMNFKQRVKCFLKIKKTWRVSLHVHFCKTFTRVVTISAPSVLQKYSLLITTFLCFPKNCHAPALFGSINHKVIPM